MQYFRLNLMILGLVLWSGVAHAMPPQLHSLPNGLQVVIQQDDRFPLASARLFVRAGSAWEKPEEAGMSHVLEHMLFKGSKTRPVGLESFIEGVGGYTNAYTTFDVTVYQVDVPAAGWKQGLEALRDMAFDPLLEPKALAGEIDVVLEEKRGRSDNAFTPLMESMYAKVLQGTPYEWPIIGYESTLKAITAESMRAYIKRLYDPQNMMLVVAGQVDAAAVLNAAEEFFGSYTNKTVSFAPGQIDPQLLQKGFQVSVQPGQWNKVYISIGFPVPGTLDDRAYPLDVLGSMLGGGDTSLLARKLRFEKGLVDFVGAGLMDQDRVGMFVVYALLDQDKLPAFWDALMEQMSSLSAESFTQKDMDRVKLEAADSYYRGRETLEKMVSAVGYFVWRDPSDPTGRNSLKKTMQVDSAAIQNAIDTWLQPQFMTLSALVPEVDKAPDFAAIQKDKWPGKGATDAKKEELGQDSASPVVTVDLGQGRKVVLMPDANMPYFSLNLYAPGGTMLLDLADPAQAGLSTATYRLLTEGAGKRSAEEMRLFLAERASTLRTSGANLEFSLSADGPTRFMPEVLELVLDVMKDPSFSQKELERIRREQKTSITMAEDKQESLLGRHLRPFLFPNSPYGVLLDGTPENVDAFTPEQIRSFWQKQLAQPWTLAVSGDFDREAVLSFAQSLPVPTAAKREKTLASWTAQKELKLSLPNRNQAMLGMLFPTVPMDHPDSAGLSLLGAALNGFGGLLMQELREERNICYSTWAEAWPGGDAGYFNMMVIADPKNLDEAQKVFQDIMKTLRETPLDAAQVESSKARFTRSYFARQQSLMTRAATAAQQVQSGREHDFLKKRIESMEKLTPKDLQVLAQKYLDPAQVYTIQVTP